MTGSLSHSARQVQKALERMGFDLRVVELPDSTRSAQEAAQAIGCRLGQIAKSLIFKTQETGRAVMVIASGSNRVDERRIGEMVGEKLKKADADYVRRETGFAIGGVPPMGHIQAIETYIDEDLLAYDQIWAAAGTPHAVFMLTAEVLVQATQGKVIQVKS